MLWQGSSKGVEVRVDVFEGGLGCGGYMGCVRCVWCVGYGNLFGFGFKFHFLNTCYVMLHVTYPKSNMVGLLLLEVVTGLPL